MAKKSKTHLINGDIAPSGKSGTNTSEQEEETLNDIEIIECMSGGNPSSESHPKDKITINMNDDLSSETEINRPAETDSFDLGENRLEDKFQVLNDGPKINVDGDVSLADESNKQIQNSDDTPGSEFFCGLKKRKYYGDLYKSDKESSEEKTSAVKINSTTDITDVENCEEESSEEKTTDAKGDSITDETLNQGNSQEHSERYTEEKTCDVELRENTTPDVKDVNFDQVDVAEEDVCEKQNEDKTFDVEIDEKILPEVKGNQAIGVTLDQEDLKEEDEGYTGEKMSDVEMEEKTVCDVEENTASNVVVDEGHISEEDAIGENDSNRLFNRNEGSDESNLTVLDTNEETDVEEQNISRYECDTVTEDKDNICNYKNEESEATEENATRYSEQSKWTSKNFVTVKVGDKNLNDDYLSFDDSSMRTESTEEITIKEQQVCTASSEELSGKDENDAAKNVSDVDKAILLAVMELKDKIVESNVNTENADEATKNEEISLSFLNLKHKNSESFKDEDILGDESVTEKEFKHEENTAIRNKDTGLDDTHEDGNSESLVVDEVKEKVNESPHVKEGTELVNRENLSDNEKARRSLLMDLGMELLSEESDKEVSDDSDELRHVIKRRRKSKTKSKRKNLNVKKLPESHKRTENSANLEESSDSSDDPYEDNEEKQTSISENNDPVEEVDIDKLKGQLDLDNKLCSNPQVLVQKLPDDVTFANNPDENNKPAGMKRNQQSSESSVDELEKDVQRLSNLSALQKKNKLKMDKTDKDGDLPEGYLDNSQRKIKMKHKKAKILSGSESLTEGSDLEEELDKSSFLKDIQKSASKDLNQEAKEFLLKQASITSSDESEDKTEKELKIDSKTDVNKENKELKPDREEKKDTDDDSLCDFKTISKKKKYHKLLRVKITDSEEEEENNSSYEDKSKIKSSQAKRRIFSSDDDDFENAARKTSDTSDNSSMYSDGEKTKKRKRKSSDEDKRGARSYHKQPKKRKRIKMFNTSESNSDDNIEIVSSGQQSLQDTPSGKGRRNIRKVISDKKLQEQTKVAAQEEKERRRRVLERQKLYNQVVDRSGETGEDVTKKLVLELDPKTKKELVEVNPLLISKLKHHQVEGVKFMWECTVESLEQLKSGKGSGCILAHCMGLGKTLQVITFIHTLLTNEYTKEFFSSVLVVCPYNTVLNWNREFDLWLEEDELKINVQELASIRDNYVRASKLDDWKEEGGVMIMGYDLFRLLVQDKSRGKRVSKKLRDRFYTALLDPGPDLVVCDEGHILKNNTSAIFKAMNRIVTKRRIVLTGTPLQNNLAEYHCMVDFVKQRLLGTKKEFFNRFVNPITNGQCADSTPHDVKLMKKRVHILHKLLEGCVQRCDYNVIRKHLQAKHEYVVCVRLSDTQIKLYQYFLDNMARGRQVGSHKVASVQLFSDYSALRQIWTHPYILYLNKIRKGNKMTDDWEDSNTDISVMSEEEGDDDVICLENPEPGTSSNKKDGDSSEEEVIKKWKTSRLTREKNQEPDSTNRDEDKEWWSDILPEEESKKIELSGKLVLLFEILNRCEEIGDKVVYHILWNNVAVSHLSFFFSLLFSQSLLLLDLVEDMLERKNQENNEISDPEQKGYYGTWLNGLDYFRMDGSTSADSRKRWIEHFNDLENGRSRLFLISTKAGSLGTNLIGANRVIIMDTSWNPSHDTQAIFRVYRFGQKKPVYIYRFLSQGTMEEKIYDRQVTKLSLSCRVVDDQQIERHFNAADLAELYSFKPDIKSNRPTPMVPKDRLLADLLYQYADWIVSYHEHDSLLQNNPEEDLTEEERQSAWQEYEAEREGTGANMNQRFQQQQFRGNPTQNTNAEFQEVSQKINEMIQSIKTKNPNQSAQELSKSILSSLQVTRNYLQTQQLGFLRQKQQYMASKQMIPPVLTDAINRISRRIQSFAMYERYWQTQQDAPQQAHSNQFRNPSAATHQNRAFIHQQQQPYVRVQNPNIRTQQPTSNRNIPTFVHNPGVQWRFTQVGRARVPQAVFPSGVTITPVPSDGKGEKTGEERGPQPIITEVDDTDNIIYQSSQNYTSRKTPTSVTIEEVL
ncbi:ATRX chromatin remodeler XNP isoform X1 [Tachypleus tridentatus]|uniref:ATRX chromatin remodeler XNP isoform X1 n=1 Tax=Tachypleus tridentatus TaxID=6853 RepID=UPI003FD4EBD1